MITIENRLKADQDSEINTENLIMCTWKGVTSKICIREIGITKG